MIKAEPEIEETNDDNVEFVEDVREIYVGETYEISAFHKKCFSEVEKFYHPEMDKSLSTDKLWRNGTFKLKVSNEEEKEEIENCKGDGGSEWQDAF